MSSTDKPYSGWTARAEERETILAELDRVGSRRMRDERLTWDEARARVNMEEPVFRQAWPAFYGYVEMFRPGEETRWAFAQLIPDPDPVALLWERGDYRLGAVVLQNPWEILRLDDASFTAHRERIQRTAKAFDEALREWGQAAFRLPPPQQLVAASDAYKTEVRRLVTEVVAKAKRRLSSFEATLPQSAYAELRDQVYITHVLKAIDRIQATVAAGWDRFASDLDAQDATVRRLEVIAQSAKELAKGPCRDRYPDVQWSELAKLRDRLAKGYPSGIDLEIIWATARDDVPQLQRALRSESS